MSGIVGIIHTDGSPVDEAMLVRMTRFMSYRGPDKQDTWINNNVGFGHALLRTTFESEHEHQPLFENDLYITADVRIDGRSDLIRKLESATAKDLRAGPDVELLLHAYRVWGNDCVQHLLGDFAFAIWDARKQLLFCARDHMGVKPFYYVRKGKTFLFSNTINCLRTHPDVSDDLNEQAIGDFLLFGWNYEPRSTAFSNIHCLPPAHTLTLQNDNINAARYWSLPEENPIQYRRSSEYVEHFKELLDTAVGDRLRTDRVGVSMSGGLDSPSIAATARKLLANRGNSFDLRAYTIVYDRLFRDEERHYSGLVAKHMNIPITYQIADVYELYERWDQPGLRKPQPDEDPLLAMSSDQLKSCAAQCRVMLTGYDGDTILNEPTPPYLHALLKDRQFIRFLGAVAKHLRTARSLPHIGIRTALRRWLGKLPPQPLWPGWLNPEFAERLSLVSRWQEVLSVKPSTPSVRPQMYRAFEFPAWRYLFENYDPGVTTYPLEARHPFVDIRLILFLISVPPIPFCVRKHLLRMSMRGLLPEAILNRPKTPLAGDPYLTRRRVDHFEPDPSLARFVEASAIRPVADEHDISRLWINLRPRTFNRWLRYQTLDSVTLRQHGLDPPDKLA